MSAELCQGGDPVTQMTAVYSEVRNPAAVNGDSPLLLPLLFINLAPEWEASQPACLHLLQAFVEQWWTVLLVAKAPCLDPS